MKIIVLGAGAVGLSVANVLSAEANDVTVVDLDDSLLGDVQDRLDINTIHGMGSHPEILEKAGAPDADMIIAVTSNDETNMIACQIASTIYHIPTKVARVRSSSYLKTKNLFAPEAIPIDVVISPEQIVTDHIQRLIDYQGALQVLDFAGGRVQMVGIKAYSGGPLIGERLRTIRQHIPGINAKVTAIYRKENAIMPTGDTFVEIDDDIFFLAEKKHIRKVMSEMRHIERPVKRIVLAGGGHVGKRLAKALERNYQVKLIEQSKERVRHLSETLHNTLILHGDVADEELLAEENIDRMDIFCAITNDDEANIMSAMLAKRMGAKKVMAIINRSAYVDLIEGGDIDIVISPRQVTIGTLLAHVRRGDIVAVHSLRKGAAEAIEVVAHGDEQTSKVVGRRIDDLDLPPGSTIGAVVRGDEVLILEREIVVQPDDHIILFLADKNCIPAVERLFQVDVGFI